MLKLEDLNAASREEFTRLLGSIFEHSPWIPARTCAQRPFASRDALQAALRATVEKASAEEQLGLIRAHPDLVGRAVLTSESQGEQASAGLGIYRRRKRNSSENTIANIVSHSDFPLSSARA